MPDSAKDKAPKQKRAKAKPAQSQALQVIKRQDEIVRQPSNRRMTILMNTFLRHYEDNCGNISMAAQLSGISRRSYYRWTTGTLPIHLRFQRKIAKIHPRQKLIDAAHAVVQHHLGEKNLTAAMFTINTFREPEVSQELRELIDKVAVAYRNWLHDFPTAPIEEKLRWLGRFAETAKVPPAELAKRVGMTEPQRLD